MDKWNDRKSVKKGNVGERIVNDWLKNRGFIIYQPITDCAHGFDRIISKNREQLIIAEIKTKAKRNSYPDTGINYKHYLEYKKISELHNLPVWIFFVDEMLGEIYGGKLSDFEKPDLYVYKGKKLSYPRVEENNIFLPAVHESYCNDIKE